MANLTERFSAEKLPGGDYAEPDPDMAGQPEDLCLARVEMPGGASWLKLLKAQAGCVTY